MGGYPMLDLISNGFALRKKLPVVNPQETRSKSATDMSCPVTDSAISAESAEVMNPHKIYEYISSDDGKNYIFRDYSGFHKDSVAETADIAETQSGKRIDAADLLRDECGFSLEHNKTNMNYLMRTYVIEFVQSSCQGVSVSASHVLEHLLSNEDINDIADGNTPMEALKLHIKLWIVKGKPHYSSRAN